MPLEALAEVWDPMRHDEVIVCTLPGQSSKWLRGDLPHAVARFTRRVGAARRRARPGGRAGDRPPAPVHEKAPLGPLSVLAWGGKQALRRQTRHAVRQLGAHQRARARRALDLERAVERRDAVGASR